MGQLFCCGKVNDYHHDQNQYLLQMNRYKEKNVYKKYEEPFSYNEPKDLEENIISKNGKFSMLYYDINKNETIIMEKKLEDIRSLDGMSEINFNNNLYICGNKFLYEINPLNPETIVLSDLNYWHCYPSLISIKEKYIYCIGGKNQCHCELYDIDTNTWSALPNLPEERYLCSLCYDKKNNIIYLFGGINNKNEIHGKKLPIEYDYFLRLKEDLNIGLVWEKILVKNNKNLLNRISAATLIFEGNENFIFILGGEDEENHLLNDIIKYDINNQSFIQLNHKLNFPTKFFNQYSIKSDMNNFLYVFLDMFNNPINIDKHNFFELNIDELKI